MPYIKAERRADLSHKGPMPTNAGELNYAVTSLVDWYLVAHGKRYATLNEVIGVLECAKLELYRRVAAPYEDTKIAENGDVYHA